MIRAVDEWLGVGMEVAEHCIALPTPNNMDFIGVKASKEECHCTTGVERTSGNFLWTHSSMARDAGDHGRGDCRLSACLIIVDMQRSVG